MNVNYAGGDIFRNVPCDSTLSNGHFSLDISKVIFITPLGGVIFLLTFVLSGTLNFSFMFVDSDESKSLTGGDKSFSLTSAGFSRPVKAEMISPAITVTKQPIAEYHINETR